MSGVRRSSRPAMGPTWRGWQRSREVRAMSWLSWPGCTYFRFIVTSLKFFSSYSFIMQGVVAYHLGRDREARLQLEKVKVIKEYL